jgi:hypothetical protein
MIPIASGESKDINASAVVVGIVSHLPKLKFEILAKERYLKQ